MLLIKSQNELLLLDSRERIIHESVPLFLFERDVWLVPPSLGFFVPTVILLEFLRRAVLVEVKLPEGI